MTGIGCLLTAVPLRDEKKFKCMGTDACAGYGGGISIDQFIASQLPQKTPFPALTVAVQPRNATVWSRLSYLGSGNPVTPYSDPNILLNALFGGGNVSGIDRAGVRQRRQSVLSFVANRLSSYKNALPQADRQALELHFDAISELEKRIAGLEDARDCMRPTFDPLDAEDNDAFPDVLDVQSRLVTHALRCDMTRVVTIQWSKAVSPTIHRWLGHERRHHDLSHDSDSKQSSVAALTDINRWYALQMKNLLDYLGEIKEGDGTLLDSTTVLWCNELGRGNSHSRDNIPFVLYRARPPTAGNQLLQFPKRSHSDLLVTLAHHMGIEIPVFGQPEHCTGPISELL
jgi:hypothetical protein